MFIDSFQKDLNLWQYVLNRNIQRKLNRPMFEGYHNAASSKEIVFTCVDI